MPDELVLPIAEFHGDYDFLSNFFRESFEWRGHIWQTSEHAYQATKSTTDEDLEYVKSANGPAEAKNRGREIKCREDWEKVKEAVMLDILRVKFAPSSWLSGRLLATGDAELIEGNSWHDKTWGVCNCSRCGGKGKNLLGKTLMKIRAELKEQQDGNGQSRKD